VEADIETVLVLSGVTSREDISRFPYRPRHILEGVFEIPEGQSKGEE
jgi:NagD protein